MKILKRKTAFDHLCDTVFCAVSGNLLLAVCFLNAKKESVIKIFYRILQVVVVLIKSIKKLFKYLGRILLVSMGECIRKSFFHRTGKNIRSAVR